MNPIEHPSNNDKFAPPPGVTEEECATLRVTRTFEGGFECSQSYWQPTPEELAALARGNPVVLTVFGTGHPMVSLGVEA